MNRREFVGVGLTALALPTAGGRDVAEAKEQSATPARSANAIRAWGVLAEAQSVVLTCSASFPAANSAEVKSILTDALPSLALTSKGTPSVKGFTVNKTVFGALPTAAVTYGLLVPIASIRPLSGGTGLAGAGGASRTRGHKSGAWD